MLYFRLILTLFLSGLTFCAFSQIKIRGETKDSLGHAIENVNVVLISAEQDILAYSVSDHSGKFSLTSSESIANLQVQATCIGYQTALITLAKGQVTVQFILKTANELLKDIIIKSPVKAVSLRKDTINYNVSAFTDSSDRVAIDIIKKLPGVTVSDNGQISYNGKAINKFYIEGQDLLEGRYNIASNNLPSKDIDKIQILPDHQPIKVLNGLVSSDRAALNIKLKNASKSRLLGAISASLAAPIKYRNENAALLDFSKNLQFINIVKTNNVGINLDNEIEYHNLTTDYLRSGSINHDLLSLIKPEYPSLDESRYRFNNNTLFTTSELLKLSPSLVLKFNAGYELDQIKESPSSLTKIFLPSDTIVIPENHQIINQLSKKYTGVILESNRDKLYFRESLQLQQFAGKSSDILTPAIINQTLQNPYLNIINEFSGILRANQHLLTFSSFNSYNDQPHQLEVSPGQFVDSLNVGKPYFALLQRIELRGFYTNNTLSYGKTITDFVISNKVSFTQQNQHLSNDLSKIIAGLPIPITGDYQNVTRRNQVKIADDVSLAYNRDSFTGTILLKANYNVFQDKSQGVTQQKKGLFFNPELYIKFRITNQIENVLTASTQNMLTDDINNSYVLSNYRTLTKNNIPITSQNSFSSGYNINYQNVVTGIFANAGIVYTHSRTNILPFETYDGIATITNFIFRDNPSNHLLSNVSADKYFEKIKTNITIGLAYDLSSSLSIQQNDLLTLRNKTSKLFTKFNVILKEDLALDYSANYSLNTSQVIQSSVTTDYPAIRTWNQKINFKYFFTDAIQAHLTFQQFYTQAEDQKANNVYFGDVSLIKTLNRPKVDISLGIFNMLNRKTFNSAFYSGNTLINTNYPLIGRMFSFKLTYQF